MAARWGRASRVLADAANADDLVTITVHGTGRRHHFNVSGPKKAPEGLVGIGEYALDLALADHKSLPNYTDQPGAVGPYRRP